LFSAAKEVHVVNADDEHVSFFLQFSAKKKYLYSAEQRGEGRILGESLESDEKGVRFAVEGVRFKLPLLGSFNAYNALAAIAAARSQNIPFKTARKALERMERVPGRMEEVVSSPFRVIVDYAFTPAALEKVYQALKSEGKLICVLGAAGGGRDAWKRPVLGEIASRYCDAAFITNEDPYDEDPRKIMEEVAAGTKGKAKIIPDRREAIAQALTLAQAGDTVVITGKGSEDSIAEKGKKIPWDDRDVAREEFEKRKRPS
ncbi:MAG: cyanophycin synthetase, partial [bacterium]|nr:cyanophycin synthetase [bacterium]